MRYMLPTICITIIVTLAAIASEAQNAAAPPAAQIDHGRALFIADGCSECHGTVGQGSRVAGPRLAPDTIPLDTFIGALRKPRNEMPPYVPEVLSDADAGDIHAYLASIPGPKENLDAIPGLNR
jgi:mono/diheme cytochrome c family protein